MFRGYNKPSRQNIFGPSGTGGTWADSRQHSLYMRGEGLPWSDHRQDALYMHGEGLGSMFGSIFRKIIPLASKAVKKIASSKVLRETGKQVLDSGVNALANVAANTISGEKSAKEAISDELQNARNEIGNAIRTANLKRKNDDDDEIEVTPAKRKNIKIRIKSSKRNRRKPIRRSVFDDDDE